MRKTMEQLSLTAGKEKEKTGREIKKTAETTAVRE